MGQKRGLVDILRQGGLKVREAFDIAGIKRSTYYYNSRSEDKVLLKEIRDIAYKYPFYGYRRVWIVLRQKGYKINHKKVYRLYHLMSLQKPYSRKGNKSWLSSKGEIKLTEPDYSNHVWGMDFCFTHLEDGRLVKIFTIEDGYSRKGLWVSYGYSITSKGVEEAIEQVIKDFGSPRVIRSDNGSEFRSKGLKRFFIKERIQHEFIPKGKPWNNGKAERFIGSLKRECLNMLEAKNLKELSGVIDEYMEFYNKERPHQALGYRTPEEIYEDKNRSI